MTTGWHLLGVVIAGARGEAEIVGAGSGVSHAIRRIESGAVRGRRMELAE